LGRDRLHAFRIAAGSAAEARSALAVAQAWGYVSAETYAQANALADRLLAMLWRLTHPRP
jgi:four helix bundle protein